MRVSDIPERVRADVAAWVDKRRPGWRVLDFVQLFLERDRDSDASVMGAAIALRVFLFFVPLLLVGVGLLGFIGDHVSSGTVTKELGVSGTLAHDMDVAIDQSSTARWTAFVIGLFGAAWAGRTLAKTLAAASRRAWDLDTPHKTPPVKIVGAVAGLIGTLGVLTTVANRMRNAFGIGIGATILVGSAVAYAMAWFIASVVLPRRPSDPSALLPGAVLVGATLAVLQGFTQFYISNRMAHASDLYGSIGIIVVTLGWFFIIGRLFVTSFVLNAVIFERFGSLTQLVFALPGVRRVPGRYPAIARWFGLRLDDDAT
jgi:uncharacterized BrkB/YihY/UPF0761 family membrane protein